MINIRVLTELPVENVNYLESVWSWCYDSCG